MVKYRDGERGQALVLVALAFIVLLIFVGLALDGGMVFLERRRMQNAADAAALAGAQALTAAMCHNDDAATADAAIYAAVVEYAQANGVKSAGDIVAAYLLFNDSGDVVEFDPQVLVGSGAVPDGAAGVAVTTSIEHGTHLISLAGVDTAGASAPAEAVTGPLLAAGGGLPITMDVDLVGELGMGTQFRIVFGNCHGDTPCSITDLDGDPIGQHRGWLNLDYIYNYADAPDFPRVVSQTPSNAKVKSWIEEGTGPIIYAGHRLDEGYYDGDFIHAIPGERATDIKLVCTYHQDKLVYIPLFDALVQTDPYMEDMEDEGLFQEPSKGWATAGGGWYYHVVGFVGFYVRDCDKEKSDKYIQGEFVEAIIGAGVTSPNAGFNNGVCEGQTMVVTLVE